VTTPRPGSRAEQRRRTEARILAAGAGAVGMARYQAQIALVITLLRACLLALAIPPAG
jgi:hypothetical protein